MVLRKSDIDLAQRTGELTEDEVEHVITLMQDPCSTRSRLVLEQKEGYEGREVQPDPG